MQPAAAAVFVVTERDGGQCNRSTFWAHSFVRIYLCVCSVRAELIEDERIQQVHVTGHLLHTTQLALLFGVGELNDQAG